MPEQKNSKKATKEQNEKQAEIPKLIPDSDIDSELDIDLEEGVEDESEASFEHYRFISDKGQSSLRVDKFITNRMEKTSRHRVQLAIAAGYVLVNGKVVKANHIVKALDVVTLVLPYQRRGFELKPENIPLDIPYEDEDLLLVNKPAGLVVHPGHGHFSGTLINALAYHLGITQPVDAEDERMGILVHRIDKNTSGLLLVAKNDESQLALAKQFFDHTIQRKYIALVWGNVKQESGTITGHVGRDPNDRMRFRVFPDGSTGKHAITHYSVIERFGYTTLIECVLETGRTHQIRVHMDYLGHPLFNDDRYGGDKILKGTVYNKYKKFVENCFEMMPRHALHAKTLGFVHPRTKANMLFENEIPADFSGVIEKWRTFYNSRTEM
ncbi:MAG: RNA pseudouridine synthase [Bacteroidetes bacterium HGW-Bacteroidetes-8]|jgi:23S rRNA pseudouridine1911/1915/1917 synthase|nr:MAG: RNA pseudouridine synthase [Bacteroidetes bacterium HGW-Bacteroidetes-8]